MNPEFERNLWLEASPRRLTGLAVALGLIYAALGLGTHGDAHGLMTGAVTVGLIVFAACGGIWAARAAGGSVLDEIRGRTWDFQRLSALTPWQMTWGKLIGAGALAWVGAATGLAAAGLATAVIVSPLDGLILIAGLLGLGVFLQGCAMGAALIGVRKARAEGRIATSGAVLLGVFGGIVLLGLLSKHLLAPGQSWTGGGFGLIGRRPVLFWGQELPGPAFAAASLCAFAAWAIAGAWRLMRLELQVKNSPWVWVAFLIFTGLWRAGQAAPEGGAPGKALTAAAVFAALAYAAAFVEPADPLRLRRLAGRLGRGELAEAFAEAPAAAFPLALTVLCVLIAMVTPKAVFADTPTPTVAAAALVFLFRDLAVIAFFRFGPSPGRGDLSAVIALALLYGVGGVVDQAVGRPLGVALFSPLANYAPLAVMISGVVQAAAAWVMAGQRIFAHAGPPTAA